MTFGQVYALYLAPFVILAFGLSVFGLHLLAERRWSRLERRGD